MKIRNVEQVNAFMEAVDKCEGEVWLESLEGDKFNLKSTLSQYVAVGALLSEKGESLELFCQKKKDEIHFYHFFQENPEVIEIGA